MTGDASRPDRPATKDARAVDAPGPASPAGRRGDVVALLRHSPSPMGPAEIAQRLGVHPNTIRFHLDHLVETGRVERVPVPPAGRGRPKLAFRLRRGMDPAGPRNYRLLAQVLAASLGTEPTPPSGSPMPAAGGADCWSIPRTPRPHHRQATRSTGW